MILRLVLFLHFFLWLPLFVQASEIPWVIKELVTDGRIDAIADVGNGAILAGTRHPNPGLLFKSLDYGLTWKQIVTIDTDETRNGITCLASGGKGICYLINESSEFFRSDDYGENWVRITKLSGGNNHDGYAMAYGLCVTKLGTILVSETNSVGSCIYRSTDKGFSFERIGPVSPKPLYRFSVLGNGIILNGWEGALYKSGDDGLNWEKWAQLDSTALYATEFLGAGEYIQGAESGNLFKGSQSDERYFRLIGNNGAAADDFVYLGYGMVIYTTYTDDKNIFVSYDKGETWINDGVVPTNSKGDWLDHVIRIALEDSVIAIGGTNKGFIVRASYSRDDLYKKSFDKDKYLYESELVRDINKGLLGYFLDDYELDEPEDVVIDGNYAYVPCRTSSNLAVIDISDPQNPFLAHSFRDIELTDAMGVDKHGQYIYLASFSNHTCLVLDASDPLNLQKIHSFVVGTDGPSPDRLRKVIYHDSYLYLTHSSEGKLYIADAANPAKPEIISSVATGDGAFTVYVIDEYAYVGGCFPGSSLKVIDISNKSHPKVVKTLFDKARYACTCSFRHSGDNLYAIAYSSNAFMVFDISDPLNTVEKGYLQSDQMFGTNRLSLINDKAYVINSVNDNFVEIDISDPKTPRINYLVPSRLLEKVYGMKAHNGLLFIAGRDSKSFIVIDPEKY